MEREHTTGSFPMDGSLWDAALALAALMDGWVSRYGAFLRGGGLFAKDEAHLQEEGDVEPGSSI